MTTFFAWLTKHMHILGFVGITLLIVGGMLAPGYVLTLDMIWTDDMSWQGNRDSFANTAPLHWLLSTLGLVLPAWVVQKILLVGVFFLLLYLPFRFLPFVTSTPGRWFAALLFTLNPFVYTRFLAGQWGVLLGYACLPLVLYTLHRVTEERSTGAGIRFGAALALTGLVSIHFLYLSIVVSAVWLCVYAGTELFRKQAYFVAPLGKALVVAVLVFSVLSSYWLVPALTRTSPLETRFDQSHYSGFAASENFLTPTLLNVAVLGGMWTEGEDWRYYFLWPQDFWLFWVAAVILFTLIAYGAYNALYSATQRRVAVVLLLIGILAYITALGVWGGVFSAFNLWLYETVSGWSGLRDSHKIAGVLAIVYVIFAGVGIDQLHTLAKAGHARSRTLLPILFVLPFVFGMYQLFGFREQLAPVDYPASWYEVRDMLATVPEGDKMLVLPWQGYFSLPFNRQLLVANPSWRFFGHNRVVAGRSVGVGGIYDQEVDPVYRATDSFLQEASTLPPQAVTEFLASRGIRYLLVVQNDQVDDINTWLITPKQPKEVDVTRTPVATPAESPLLESLLRSPHEKIIDSKVVLYRFIH